MAGGPMPVGPYNQSGKDPGRIVWTNTHLGRMIQAAYDVPVDRISGPDWLYSNFYDVAATMPAGTSVDDFRKMLQTLLAERFRLAVHREIKQVSGYLLEVAKNGPKLQPSQPNRVIKPDASVPGNGLVITDQNGYPAPRPGNPVYAPGDYFEGAARVNGRTRATVLNGTMPSIAAYLARFAGGPGADRTGLAGTYDVHLEFTPAPAAPATDGTPEPGADVLEAIQGQLGLKLVPGKVPVETLVIDHAEKIPAGN